MGEGLNRYILVERKKLRPLLDLRELSFRKMFRVHEIPVFLPIESFEAIMNARPFPFQASSADCSRRCPA
jgi:hypothetical protein